MTKRSLAGVMVSVVAYSLLLAAYVMGCSLKAPSRAESVIDNACRWGGLIVKKGNLELTEKLCNPQFAKEDWQYPQPDIKYPAAAKDKIYTVFVLDPDAPNHPDGVYYLHMLQANIEGSALKNGDFSQADTIASYVGPAPPEGTGLHRYMFVVYQNKPNFKVKKMDTPERWMFNFTRWLDEYGQGLVGPEAGVQFRAAFSYN